jgi:PAS domain S-box-containing protein
MARSILSYSRLAMWCLCAGGAVTIVVGICRLRAPASKDGVMKTAAMASLVDSGQSLCEDLRRVVKPAMTRTQFLASDPQVVRAILSGDKALQTQACNTAITQSTEIDAVALFNVDGAITAINTVYASGKPIEPARVKRILGLNFGQRDIIQKCVRNNASTDVLEFQTTCDITPAFFDSIGLSVAYSVPVNDPTTGKKIGVLSSRLRFERLTDLIKNRAIGGTRGSTQFVTDKGGYFSEAINSGKQAPPVPQNVLAGVVLPLVQGSSDYCFTQQGRNYLCLFKLKEFQTLTGGGIQVMVVADEDWLMREVTQARFFNGGLLICVGLLLVLCAICVSTIASLTQSEKWNRMLIESALDSIIALDDKGIVKTWNPQAASTFGYTSEEAVGQSLSELIFRDQPAGEQTPSASSAAQMPTGLFTGKRVEVQAVRKDGARITVEWVVTPLQVGAGIWNCIFAHDVTEQRAIEMHLAQAQRLESIGQLAAGVAHEINTPVQYVSDNVHFMQTQFSSLLAIIKKYADYTDPHAPATPWQQRARDIEQTLKTMDFDFLREEVPQAINQSIEGLNRVALIVRAMKDFSHPGSTGKEPADLNRSILSTAEVCRNRWKDAAKLETDLAADLPSVMCYVAEFNQVILNLIVNAADALAEAAATDASRKGLIRISSRLGPNGVEIRVQDNGPGIPEKVRQRIFEPFFTTKPVGKGTGQGLSLSRNIIVSKHGGELNFEPTEGGGTTFVIRLPIGEPQQMLKEAA